MRLLPALLVAALPAHASVPAVVADTPAVHSLVAMVMAGVGEPALLMGDGASPHHAALAPSAARALAGADVVVWTGAGFRPEMGEAIAALAPEAVSLPLLDSEGWERLKLREGTDLHEHGADGHVHVMAHEVADDPHAWLDPAVAAAWLGTIAATLGAADPGHADAYAANAAQGAERLGALRVGLRARFAPLGGRGWIAGHDAYQYLERAAGVPAAGAVRDWTGMEPAPEAAVALRERVAAGGIACLLLDAETGEGWAATLGDGALRTAVADPDGATLAPGPALYESLVAGVADALAACLAP